MNKAIHYATKKLKEYREDRGWSQAAFADWLTLQFGREISRRTVNYWENGKRPLNADDALELSLATKIAVNELFTQEQPTGA